MGPKIDMEDDVDEVEPIANGAPKKGRGRPPKTLKIDMEDDVNEEEPIANGAPKKGRGRPPKASKIAPQPASELISEYDGYYEDSEDILDAGEKEDSDDVEWGKYYQKKKKKKKKRGKTGKKKKKKKKK